MFSWEDRRFLELLKLLEKRDSKVDVKFVKELEDRGWNLADVNSQLYQIWCGCSLSKSTAQQKFMAFEGRKNIRGYILIQI